MAAPGVGAMGGEEREAGSSAAEGAPWTPQSHIAPLPPGPKKKSKTFPCSFEALVPGLIAAQQAVCAAPRRFRFAVSRPNTNGPQLYDLHQDASATLWAACRKSAPSAHIKTPMAGKYLDVEPKSMKGVLLTKGVVVQGAVVECLPTAKTTKALNIIDSQHPVLAKLRQHSDLGLHIDLRPAHEAVLRGAVSRAFWETVVEQQPDKDRLEFAAVARASVAPSLSRPPVLRLKKVLFFLPLTLLSEHRLLKAASKPHYMTSQAQVDKALDEAVKKAAELLRRLEARPDLLLDAHFKQDMTKTLDCSDVSLMEVPGDEEDADAPAPSQPLAEEAEPASEAVDPQPSEAVDRQPQVENEPQATTPPTSPAPDRSADRSADRSVDPPLRTSTPLRTYTPIPNDLGSSDPGRPKDIGRPGALDPDSELLRASTPPAQPKAPPTVPKAPPRKREAVPASPADTPPLKGRQAGRGEASQPLPEAQEPTEAQLDLVDEVELVDAIFAPQEPLLRPRDPTVGQLTRDLISPVHRPTYRHLEKACPALWWRRGIWGFINLTTFFRSPQGVCGKVSSARRSEVEEQAFRERVGSLGKALAALPIVASQPSPAEPIADLCTDIVATIDAVLDEEEDAGLHSLFFARVLSGIRDDVRQMGVELEGVLHRTGIAEAPGPASSAGVADEDRQGTSAQAAASEKRPGTSAKAATRSSLRHAAKSRLPEQPFSLSDEDEDEL